MKTISYLANFRVWITIWLLLVTVIIHACLVHTFINRENQMIGQSCTWILLLAFLTLCFALISLSVLIRIVVYLLTSINLLNFNLFLSLINQTFHEGILCYLLISSKVTLFFLFNLICIWVFDLLAGEESSHGIHSPVDFSIRVKQVLSLIG